MLSRDCAETRRAGLCNRATATLPVYFKCFELIAAAGGIRRVCGKTIVEVAWAIYRRKLGWCVDRCWGVRAFFMATGRRDGRDNVAPTNQAMW